MYEPPTSRCRPSRPHSHTEMEPLSSPPTLRLFCPFLNFMLMESHCTGALVSGFFCSHCICEIHPPDNAVLIALLTFPALLYCPLASIWSVCISACPGCPQKKEPKILHLGSRFWIYLVNVSLAISKQFLPALANIFLRLLKTCVLYRKAISPTEPRES